MSATFDNNVIVNLLLTAGAVARQEFGLICYGSNDTTFAASDTKVFEQISDVTDDSELSATAKLAGAAFFSQKKHPPTFMVAAVDDEAAASELTLSLDAAFLERPFYALVLQSKAILQIVTADTWAGLNFTLHWAQSSDAPFLAGAGDATDVGYTIDQAATGRTSVTYHATDAEEIALAWAAVYLSADPDTTSTTAGNQQVTGFTTDVITPTEKANVLGNHGNLYLPMADQGIMYPGNVGGGGWIDNTLIGDWFVARVREGAQQLLIDKAAANQKLPYTQAGLQELGGVIENVQNQGENIGEGDDGGHFIPGESTVNVPTLASISAATRATRGATVAGESKGTGAIQTATVNLSYIAA